MNGYAIDTNIISFMLRGDRQLQEKVYRESNSGAGVIIPPIVYYEVKRGLFASNATVKLAAFERLCDLLGVDVMDSDTLDKAAGIYAALKRTGYGFPLLIHVEYQLIIPEHHFCFASFWRSM